MFKLMGWVMSVLLLNTTYVFAADVLQPQALQFGSGVDMTADRLKPYCSSLSVRSIVPITAPLAKQEQTQIDCSGFLFAGKKRHIEVVFQDDQLDIIWILFEPDERAQMLSQFISEFGEPTMDIAFGTLFLQANAALRNQPSEVLFASDRQVKVMMAALKD